MPQNNSHIPLSGTFEFNMQEEFAAALKPERFNLTLITKGETTLCSNGITFTAVSPCILLSSSMDELELMRSDHLSAKTFSFHPAFINSRLTFANITKSILTDIAEHDRSLLYMLFLQNELNNRIVRLMPQMFLRISEWFDLAAIEFKVKSNLRWLFHVRRYLMQMLFALEETIENHNESDALSDEAIINFIIEYIHTNYTRKISLDSLCKMVCMNRTSLNNMFKARTRRSPINYLLHHRLNIACELLTYTKISIARIAEAAGFKYETYFTRQFTKKIGITPTQYRISEGYETLNNIESRIIDEF